MRQRLSSEPDRYRGRRRVATPPRSRYAIVGAAAVVGAGVVALGASNFPDAKAVNPTVLQDLGEAKFASDALASRDDPGAASRGEKRAGADAAQPTQEQIEAEAWMLPLDDYVYTSPFGVRWGKLHAGIDLAAEEGTPFKAIHAGKVTQSGYNGAYGYSITVLHTDGTEIIYGHARKVLVPKGAQVKAGETIAEVGNTGASYGTHLHVEIHVEGKPVDPLPLLREHGVDIKLRTESIYVGATS